MPCHVSVSGLSVILCVGLILLTGLGTVTLFVITGNHSFTIYKDETEESLRSCFLTGETNMQHARHMLLIEATAHRIASIRYRLSLLESRVHEIAWLLQHSTRESIHLLMFSHVAHGYDVLEMVGLGYSMELPVFNLLMYTRKKEVNSTCFMNQTGNSAFISTVNHNATPDLGPCRMAQGVQISGSCPIVGSHSHFHESHTVDGWLLEDAELIYVTRFKQSGEYVGEVLGVLDPHSFLLSLAVDDEEEVTRMYLVYFSTLGEWHGIEHGTLLAVSHGSIQGKNSSDPLIAEYHSYLLQHGEGAESESEWDSADGTHFWAYQAPLNHSGLPLQAVLLRSSANILDYTKNITAEAKIKVNNARDETLAYASDMLAMSLVGWLVYMTILGCTALGMTKRLLSKPLSYLEKKMKAISRMHIDSLDDMQESSLKEIVSIQESFVQMVMCLQQYRAHIAQAALVEAEQEPTETRSPPFRRPRSVSMLNNTIGTVMIVCPGYTDVSTVNERYLNYCIVELEKHDGVIHSLAADVVVATFNCHSSVVRHPFAACHCCLAISNQVRSDVKGPKNWAAAVHTGRFYFGTIGNASTKSCTCVGATITQCGSLVKLANLLSVRVLISEACNSRVNVKLFTRPVDVIAFVHKQNEYVYELLREPVVEKYMVGFSSFEANNYKEALEAFNELAKNNSKDEQVWRILKHCMYSVQCEIPFPATYVREIRDEWPFFEAITGSVRLPDELAQFITYSVSSDRSSIPASPRLSIDSCDLDDRVKVEVAKHIPSSFIDSSRQSWYRSNRLLGKGRLGKVWLGMNEKCSPAALRSTNPISSRQSLNNPIVEVSVLSSLSNEYIVAYYDTAVAQDTLFILMEYYPGESLARVIEQFGVLPFKCISSFLEDILKGLSYLHANNVVHSDLKPENVLLGAEGHCKLCDYGTSSMGDFLGTQLGTPCFMAPEACRGHTEFASDIWGFGIITIVLLGGTPYESMSRERLLHNLGSDEAFMPTLPVVSCDIFDMITSCLTRATDERPAAPALLKSSVFAENGAT